MVLCLAAIDYLHQVRWQVQRQQAAAIAVCVMLGIGSITALHEIARALLMPRWDASMNAHVYLETNGAPHYFAHIREPWFAAMLAPINLQYVHERVPGANP